MALAETDILSSLERTPIDTLREIIKSEEGMIIVGSILGRYEKLKALMLQLNLVKGGGRTHTDRVRIVSIGNAISGQSVHDLDTLLFCNKYFHAIIAGNREAALMGGVSYPDQRSPYLTTELRDELRILAPTGRLTAALVYADVLITHAGVSTSLHEHHDPVVVAADINARWNDFQRRAAYRDPLLFGQPSSGYPTTGVLWQSWQRLQDDFNPHYRQVTGHTLLSEPETNELKRLYGISLDEGIGCAFINKQGKIYIAALD